MSPTMTGTRAHWNTAVGGDGKNEIGGEVAIARPPDEVFEVLVDPRNEPRYNRRMLRAEKVTPGPIGVGTRFRQVATGLGRRGETVTELTGCDRPRRLTYRIGSAAMDITGEETLEPVAGGTLFAGPGASGLAGYGGRRPLCCASAAPGWSGASGPT